MTLADLGRIVVFLASAVLIGEGIGWALIRVQHHGSKVGAVLFAGGLVALLLAVVKYGQTVTPGVILALVGTVACALGVLLLRRTPDA